MEIHVSSHVDSAGEEGGDVHLPQQTHLVAFLERAQAISCVGDDGCPTVMGQCTGQ